MTAPRRLDVRGIGMHRQAASVSVFAGYIQTAAVATLTLATIISYHKTLLQSYHIHHTITDRALT